MTDNEIIKALEYCATHKDTCDDCHCVIYQTECAFNDPELVFDIINRQKAEIERLNSYLEVISYSTGKIKAEAIKEFAERLKEFNKERLIVWDEHIDNLVKEMVGDF